MSASKGFLDNVFLRRFHSLLGVVPIGVFMIIHLTTNSSVVWGSISTLRTQGHTGIDAGVYTFQHEVSFINNLPLLLLTEIFVLWVPIAIHAILGIYYATSGKGNLKNYNWSNNFRYMLQRLTAWIGLVFILYHVGTLRWGWEALMPGDTKWSHYFASSTLALALRGEVSGFNFGGILVSLLYFLGVASLVFHFANGLWTAAITWGLTISTKAQKQWGVVCSLLGVGLMGAGMSALFGFMFLVDYDDAHLIEREMIVEKYGEEYYHHLLQKYGIEDVTLIIEGTEADKAHEDAATHPFPGPAPKVETVSHDGELDADGAKAH